MGNRILKESICRSEEIDSLSWFEEVLFYRLIVNCDDYGRFDGRERVIKGYCFPLKSISDSEITDALQKLVNIGLVKRYKVDGKPVLQLSSWEHHQRIRTKRAKYPSIDEADECSASSCCVLQQIAADCSELQQVAADGSKKLPESNPIQSESNPNPNPIRKQSEHKDAPQTTRKGEEKTPVEIINESDLSEPMKIKTRQWLDYKQQQFKFKYKEIGFRSLLKEIQTNAKELGEDRAIEAIDRSMGKGYKGIIWDLVKKQPQKYSTDPFSSFAEGMR